MYLHIYIYRDIVRLRYLVGVRSKGCVGEMNQAHGCFTAASDPCCTCPSLIHFAKNCAEVHKPTSQSGPGTRSQLTFMTSPRGFHRRDTPIGLSAENEHETHVSSVVGI